MTLNSLILFMILIVYFAASIIILIYTLVDRESKIDKKSMIKCPDCGKKISINAKTCLHCNSEILQNENVVKESIVLNTKKSNYIKRKYILIIYQLLAGIITIIGFEKVDSMIPQIIFLLSLIINTISLTLFIIKNNNIRKEIKLRFSVISIIAIICGIFVSMNSSINFFNNIRLGYKEDLKEILILETYNKNEAKQLLNNIYEALHVNERLDIGSCLSLYGIWEDREQKNTYVVNIKETCENSYFPPNAIKIGINSQDKTKVEKVYWEINDNTDIVLFENGNQAHEFVYLYNAMINRDKPPYPIKDYFENKVKEDLRSPSSAIFTYNNFKYSQSENRFYYDGWVEGQNAFGAMVKEDFELKLIPCEESYCEWYSLDYEIYYR